MDKKAKQKIRDELRAIDRLVGAQIAQRRQQLNLSQEELATTLGVTYQQMQKYENATNRVSAGKLHRLSKVLDVPLNYFFAPSITDATGLGDPYTYDPDFIRFVQLYPRLPERCREPAIHMIETLCATENGAG